LQVEVEDDGRRYTIAQGTRKTTKALVKLYESGSGLININGSDLLYFEHPQYREQVSDITCCTSNTRSIGSLLVIRPC
jgi:ribosomal protein S9